MAEIARSDSMSGDHTVGSTHSFHSFQHCYSIHEYTLCHIRVVGNRGGPILPDQVILPTGFLAYLP